jgi:hypothetical protein
MLAALPFAGIICGYILGYAAGHDDGLARGRYEEARWQEYVTEYLGQVTQDLASRRN